jgi:hypothetical protein
MLENHGTIDGLPLVSEDGRGAISIPQVPEVAKMRLMELENDADFLDAVMNRSHPMHTVRLNVYRALQAAANADGHRTHRDGIGVAR